jgi:hypothetical protein
VVRTDRIAVRGASGDREKVVLDAGGRRGRRSACLLVAGGDDVLIADLTCRNSSGHGVHVQPHQGSRKVRIYNCAFRNIHIRMIKGSHPKYGREPVGRDREEILAKRPVGGEIRYCLFVNDARKSDRQDGFRGDYVGGIDMMWLKDWVIADNVFVGIRGANGVGRGAIFIWVHSEGVVAERNVIVNCDRGICFGNPSGSRPHMTRGIVRNNFIVAGTSQGIEICRTVDTLVAHNTVFATGVVHPAAVQFHQGSGGARFLNNIVHGRVALDREVRSEGNVVGDCAGWFADPATGDLHLTTKAGAAARAGRLKEAADDFDAQQRQSDTHAGADERPEPRGRER